MAEVEIKILEVDVDALVKMLKGMGAQKTFDGKITPTFYDFPDRKLEKRGMTVRLRKRGHGVELTLKKSIRHRSAKIAQEFETKVADYQQMKIILRELGLKEISRSTSHLTKHRITYTLGKIHFEFDTYPGIPTLLEIEAQDIQSLRDAVASLGFTMDQTRAWTGKDVMAHYKKKA